MTPFTFKALVTLDDGEKPVNCAAGANRGLVLRGHCGPPERTMMFNAQITTDDDEPLRPGDHHRVVRSPSPTTAPSSTSRRGGISNS